jgi:RHS repeat-associated protein
VTDETIRSTNVRGLKTHEEIFETFDKSVFSPARKAPLSARRTFYYDARNRVIQSVETTPLGYGLRISYKYDYSGNILIRDEQHNISEGEPLNLRYAYTYDGRGRQLREVVSINGKVCADVASAYDELGRLQTKTAGNGLETEHKYNIQGWLSGITHRIKAPSVNLQTGDTLWIRNIIFTEQLNYFKPQAAKPLYSGNIAEISWNRGRDVMGDNTYAYSYDMLGRLTDAELYKREPSENFPGFSPLRDNTFTERRMEYDLNGNMRSFERYNGDEILKYKYLLDGNQLVRVKRDPGTKDSEGKVAFGIEEVDNPFEYDTMGNLVYDGQNQLKISYDFLNLPEKIAPAELHSQAGELFLANYCYLWNGEKVASTDVRGNGYLYIGSVRYELEGAKPAFESAPFAMGRIGRLGEEYDTRYFLNDHLGSVRAIVNQNGVVTVEYDYMPYGMQHKNSSLATSDANEFRYNGKEFLSRFCVDLYDSQARLQGMNARFNSIDPRAEEMTDISPYAYCADNPINRIDYDGEYPILLPLIKGAVGAVVDATAQVSVAMADDQGFFEALSNIDYTSIGASFMTSALLSPGMSTAAKVTTASVIAVDVAVDYSENKGLEYIGEGKTPGKAALDAAASLVPGKVARGVTSGLEKAIVSDLSSKASATLSKEIKSSLMQMQTIVNSDGFQIGTNVIANFTAGLINGQLSAIPFGGMKQTSMPQTHEIIRADALQVYKPEYKIKVK